MALRTLAKIQSPTAEAGHQAFRLQLDAVKP
jgi:hypothetical protein